MMFFSDAKYAALSSNSEIKLINLIKHADFNTRDKSVVARF